MSISEGKVPISTLLVSLWSHFNFFKKLFVNFVYIVYVWLFMYTLALLSVNARDIRFSGAGVIGNCGPSDIGVRNQT